MEIWRNLAHNKCYLTADSKDVKRNDLRGTLESRCAEIWMPSYYVPIITAERWIGRAYARVARSPGAALARGRGYLRIGAVAPPCLSYMFSTARLHAGL